MKLFRNLTIMVAHCYQLLTGVIRKRGVAGNLVPAVGDFPLQSACG